MYERLMDKTLSPTFDYLISYSADSVIFWLELDRYIKDVFFAEHQIRFPYGNKYGWSCKYSKKSKHICDVFAENGAFALHFRISNKQLGSIYDSLSDYAKDVCDNKYPCSEGGWLTYRVLSQAHVSDAKKLLAAKMNQKNIAL